MFATADADASTASTATRRPRCLRRHWAPRSWACGRASDGRARATLLNRERWAGTLELLVAAPTAVLDASLVPDHHGDVHRRPGTCVVATIALEPAGLRRPARASRAGRSSCSASSSRRSRSRCSASCSSVTAVRYRTAWALGAAAGVPRLAALRLRRPARPAARRGSTRSPARSRRPGPMEAMRSAASGESPWRELGALRAHWVRRTPSSPPDLGRAPRRLRPPQRHAGADLSRRPVTNTCDLLRRRADELPRACSTG